MGGLRRLLVFVFLLLVAGATAFMVMRVAGGQQVGPAVAICPGPDGYGYRCAYDTPLEYINATTETMLFLDDALVALDLPFTFTFYGTEYDEVQASSNGNLQFTTENSAYANDCLTPQPAAAMGDMIAPYWDDLDLTFRGFLRSEVVGQAPERIFVVEWYDVPRFGDVDDRLTFEVQLFEGSNDIFFLYQDAQTLAAAAGSQATIGLQSEEQRYALQVSCNQTALQDGSVIHFAHPEEPATDSGLSYTGKPSLSDTSLDFADKGRGAAVVAALNSRGKQGLDSLRATWLGERPRIESEWIWADLDGDGQEEVIALWRGDVTRPELVELAVGGRDDDGLWQVQWMAWPLARQERLGSLTLAAHGDVTGDGAQEIILRDPTGAGLLALTQATHGYDLMPVPGRCSGPIVLHDQNADGAQEIVLGGCPGGERQVIQWDGEAFTLPKGR